MASPYPLSTFEIKKRLKKINPSIKIIGNYKNSYFPLKCKCLECKHKWSPTWDTLVQGHGCPKCGNESKSDKLRLSLFEIKKKLKRINPSIKIVGEYKHSHSPLKCKCLECKYIWSPVWDSLGQSHGCPKCSGKQKLTILEVKNRLKRINPDIKILSKYENSRSPIKCKCQVCKHVWNPSWDNLSQGHGCPKCTSGKFEKEVIQIAERLTGWKFPKADPSMVPWLHGLHLDGYNKQNRVAIEPQGYQHYVYPNWFHKTKKDFIEQKRRDWRKKIQCYRHGVKLICIPYRVKDVESYLQRHLK